MYVNTDLGVLVESIEQNVAINTQSMREMPVSLDNSLMNFYFYMSLTEKYYDVKFKKVQEVIAEVGGFLSIIMEFLALIIIPFNMF
jgi:hypothetical protein